MKPNVSKLGEKEGGKAKGTVVVMNRASKQLQPLVMQLPHGTKSAYAKDEVVNSMYDLILP